MHGGSSGAQHPVFRLQLALAPASVAAWFFTGNVLPWAVVQFGGIALLLLVCGVLSIPGSYWPGGSFEILTDQYLKALMVFWLRGHGALLSVLGLPALYAVAAHEENRRRGIRGRGPRRSG